MWAASTLSFFFLTVGTLPVRGASTCPLPVDVEQHLSSWVLASEAGQLSAQVESDGGRVQVRLLGEKGELLSERVLDAGPTCDELAQAVAVVVASWIGELRATESSLSPLTERSAPVRTPLRAPPQRYAFEVGAGMLASLSGGSVGLGVELAAAATSLESRWGFHVVLAFLGERDLPARSERLSYERYFLGVGPHRRYDLGEFRLDVGGEGALGLLSLSGASLAPGQSTLGVVPGVAASARLVSDRGPWLGLRSLAWLKRANVATGDGISRPVPWLELELALGLSWGGR